MFFAVKLVQLFALLGVICVSEQMSYFEKLIIQNRTSASVFLNKLIHSNANLFQVDHAGRYAEKEAYDAKVNIELSLRLLQKTLLKNVSSHFLAGLHANYLMDLSDVESPGFYFSNEQKLFQQLNATWFAYCTKVAQTCSSECLKQDIPSYKKSWCKLNQHGLRPKRAALDDDSLLLEVVEEISQKNLNKNFEFINKLSDSVKNPAKKRGKVLQQKFEHGFNFENNQCLDINECGLFRDKSTNETRSQCDPNAACVNTYGSFKCKCNKGFIGDGMAGNCFSSKFCSGRLCRQNGECFYQNNRNGYKCRCMLDCKNGGVCVLGKYKYECKCPRNSTGILCNETAQDSIEKLKLGKHASNSLENVSLRKLIDLAETPQDLDKSIKFDMFNLFDEYLKKTPKKTAIRKLDEEPKNYFYNDLLHSYLENYD